jgi:hypothetical protein
MFRDRNVNDTNVMRGRKMTINNNFSGEKMNPSQYFYQQGAAEKQAPSHNIQMESNYGKGK